MGKEGSERDGGWDGMGWVGGRARQWACREVHFQLLSANGGLSQGTHVDVGALKTYSS